MEETKGKVKKIRKKAEVGSIFSKEHYDLCVAHGIYPNSSLSVKKDITRGSSKHDINISVWKRQCMIVIFVIFCWLSTQELRELIMSLFIENMQIPKYFEVKLLPITNRENDSTCVNLFHF